VRVMEMECALQHLISSDCIDVSPARLVDRHDAPESPMPLLLPRGARWVAVRWTDYRECVWWWKERRRRDQRERETTRDRRHGSMQAPMRPASAGHDG
jgi:hypothetical protein